MPEYGYGSPSSWVDTPDGWAPTKFDVGYGSPTSFVNTPDEFDSAENRDTGYGSPIIIFLANPELQTVRDFGAALRARKPV